MKQNNAALNLFDEAMPLSDLDTAKGLITICHSFDAIPVLLQAITQDQHNKTDQKELWDEYYRVTTP